MKKDSCRIYVFRTFEKKLKMMAVEKNKSLIGLTEELGQEDTDKLLTNFRGYKKNDKNIFRQ